MILFFNLGVFLMISKTTKALASSNDITKPLLVLQGGNYNDYLQYDGYTFLSSDANFNRAGDYKAKFKNNLTNEEVEKAILVRSREQLVNNNYKESFYDLHIFDQKIQVAKVKEYKGAYYIAYNVYKNDELWSLYLCKIVNKQVIFNRLILGESALVLADFIVSDEQISILFNMDYSSYKQETLLVTITQEAISRYTIRFIGSGVDTGRKILQDDKYYYVINETRSKDSYYGKDHDYQYVTIFLIRKDILSVVNRAYILEDSDVKVNDAVIRDGTLCVLTEYYDRATRLKNYDIHTFEAEDNKISDTGEHFISCSLTESALKMQLDEDDNIYMAMSDYDYEQSEYVNKLYKIDYSFRKELQGTYYYQKEASAHLVDFYVINQDEVILLYNLVDLSTDNHYGYLYQIVEKGRVTFEVESFSPTEPVSGLISPNELGFQNGNKVEVNQINYAVATKLLTTTTASTEQKPEKPKMFINGESVDPDLNKSKIHYDLSKYGTYQAYYYFVSKELDVITYGDIVVEPQVNVENDGIYDVNFKLEFNGKAKLNSLEISPGYIIKTPGEYNLIIEGVNGQNEEIHFVVKNLTNKDEVYRPSDIEVEMTKKAQTTNDAIEINNYVKNEDLQVAPNNFGMWSLLVPACVLILIVITAIKKRG